MANLKKILKNLFPLVSDVVEEKVKNRCIFPIVLFGLYIILVFVFTSGNIIVKFSIFIRILFIS